jgi:hypothetical protein
MADTTTSESASAARSRTPTKRVFNKDQGAEMNGILTYKNALPLRADTSPAAAKITNAQVSTLKNFTIQAK